MSARNGSPAPARTLWIAAGCILAAEIVTLRLMNPYWTPFPDRSGPGRTYAQSPSDLAAHRRALYDPREDPVPGSAAPDVRLYTLDGQKTALANYRGRRVALLFANDCDT